jgi:pyruvate dehydrogenase E1 component beta subunit
MRTLKYCEAIAEATVQAMEKDDTIFVMGEGVDDSKGIFGTTRPAFERFGYKRVFDTPLSENGITGWGTGAALMGLKPLMVHARNDFLLLAMDQIVNHAAKWQYMHGRNVPWTIRGIIGRSWGQAAQHSQALQPLFAYFPGLKVVMPSTPRDAKGLLIASLFDPSPVIFLEHRKLFNLTGDVPPEMYEIPLGKANIVKEVGDVTIVAVSQMVIEATRAAEKLLDIGVDAEVIDLRSIRPLDSETLIESVRKTGRLVVCDVGWKLFGISGEIVSGVVEKAFAALKAPPIRIGLPDCPTPCSYALEEIYYPDFQAIIAAVKRVLPKSDHNKFEFLPKEKEQEVLEFFGPF